MKTPDNPPAFPRPVAHAAKRPHEGSPYYNEPQDGMTLRQYYAGQFLAGFCANPAIFAHNGQSGWGLVNCTDEQLAGYADKLAGNMLECQEQRSKGGTP